MTVEAIKQQLTDFPDWEVSKEQIRKTFSFADFDAAIVFVNQVAAAASQANHHPDIDIRYDTVTLTLSTHSAGGVTEKDIELAKTIEHHRD